MFSMNMLARSPIPRRTPLPHCVPAGTRVYAVGDIHGRYDLMEQLHRQIAEDALDAPERRVLVYLGDYIDRGPQSFEVVDALIHDPLPDFEIFHLKGNHEDFLLRFLEFGEDGGNWFFNGGIPTLMSYHAGAEALADAYTNMDTLRQGLIEALPPAHLAFYHRLAMTHAEGDYLFVHAGLRPGVPLERQRDEDLMWIRGPFLHSDEDFGHLVVHGHTPDFDPVIRANRIGLDTQAYRSGCLTCLVLEGEQRRFLQT